jgi:Secretion system C-terminal sorting domain
MYFRKIHIIVFIGLSLLLSANSVFAQTWSKRFSDDMSGTPVSCRSIDRTNQGFALILNEQMPFTENDTTYSYWNLGMYKIDDFGELIFRKYYGDSTQTTLLAASNITITDDSEDIWIAGTYINRLDGISSYLGHLLKLNSNGDILLSKTYGDSVHNQGFNSVRFSFDNNLIVQGIAANHPTYPDNWTLKLDTLGSVLWSTFYGVGSRNREGSSLVLSADSGQIVIGGYEDVVSNEPAPRLWLLDSSGVFVESRNYELGAFNHSGAEGLVADAFGNYYWCGSVVLEHSPSNHDLGKHVIVKLNTDLDTLWVKQIGPDYLMYQFETHTIIPSSDGNFLCVGGTGRYQEFNSFSQGFVFKFSPNGDIIWQRYFEATALGWNIFHDLTQLTDGSIILAGHTLSYDADDVRYLEQDAWVVKTDEFGCIVPGCQVSILEEEEVADFSIYPNPARDVFNIYIQAIDPSFQGEIIISDVSGRTISKHPTYGTNLTLSLDISGFAAGMYLVQFQAKGSVIKTERFVVE